MVPEATVASVQPMWVQVAENPSKVPFSGWVTTMFCEPRMTPPPTGTSAGEPRVTLYSCGAVGGGAGGGGALAGPAVVAPAVVATGRGRRVDGRGAGGP